MKRVTVEEFQNDFDHLLDRIANDKLAVDIAENRSAVIMSKKEYKRMVSGLRKKKEDIR